MGSNYDYKIIADPSAELTDKQIRERAEQAFRQSEQAYGNVGYTGSLAEKVGLGVAIHREKIFDTIREANEHISEVIDGDKWDYADAVFVKGKGWVVGGWCPT